MSDYRRLISYIYAYEGGEKGKNIGFAKIDMRGPQCRIQVNVKKVYVGSNDIGVYLLHTGGELLLGRIFIRSGAGEFRTQVQSEDVDGTGIRIEDCYGLTIHDVENAWQSYTTIWEDAVAQTAEIQLAEVTSEHIRRQQEEKEQQERKQQERKQQEEQNQQNRKEQKEQQVQQSLPISAEIARELEAEEEKLEATAPWEENVVAAGEKNGQLCQKALKNDQESVQAESVEEAHVENMQAEPVVKNCLESTQTDFVFENCQESMKTESVAEKRQESMHAELVMENQLENLATGSGMEKHRKHIPQEGMAEMQQKNLPEERVEKQSDKQDVHQGPEDTARLAELDREENEELADTNIWKKMSGQYTKVLAFDYDNDCEILSIKPQDIGLLPREVWVYGNNSFLLHGYYNYRHLILAKLQDPQKTPRYLLGVPGHYFSNEKYMASMFGFPHFVLARKQPQGDGRFGYWYTDIRL